MTTVSERIEALNFDATTRQRWSIGNAVRDRYVKMYGQLPVKALRRKTSGIGSHCFAIYPPEFQPEIDAIIEQYKLSNERQGRLF